MTKIESPGCFAFSTLSFHKYKKIPTITFSSSPPMSMALVMTTTTMTTATTLQTTTNVLCRETSEGTVHGTGVYFAGVGPKGLALERFPDIKKEKKKEIMVGHRT